MGTLKNITYFLSQPFQRYSLITIIYPGVFNNETLIRRFSEAETIFF